MKLITKLLFVSFLFLTLLVSVMSTQAIEDDETHEDNDGIELFGGFLLQKKQTLRMTCNKFPRVCNLKGSPGSHCCKKKCVDLSVNRMNCGKCGKKCKYNEICCKGKCVNPSFSRRHCGGCNRSCKNGVFCVFGLCNYA